MQSSVANIMLLVVFIAMIYFMMIRPQRKKDKEDREMRSSLQVGDEIITIKTAIASVTRGEGSKEAAKKEPVAEPEDEKIPDRDKKVTPKKLSRKAEGSEETAE